MLQEEHQELLFLALQDLVELPKQRLLLKDMV